MSRAQGLGVMCSPDGLFYRGHRIWVEQLGRAEKRPRLVNVTVNFYHGLVATVLRPPDNNSSAQQNRIIRMGIFFALNQEGIVLLEIELDRCIHLLKLWGNRQKIANR